MRQLNAILGVFRSSRKVTWGLVIVVVIVLIGIFHAQIVHLIGVRDGQNPLELGFGPRFRLPSAQYPLGTDNQGRDELAMVVTGLWTSLVIGVEAGVISTVIGVVVAFYAAYRGGLSDSVLSTTTDLFLVIPSFPLLIAFSAFAKTTNVTEIALILAVFSWAFAARTIRSHVLSLRTRSYVDLARVSKEGTLEIVFTELMPNMLPYIALGLCYATIGAIFALVGLEVIGSGTERGHRSRLPHQHRPRERGDDGRGVADVRGPHLHSHRPLLRAEHDQPGAGGSVQSPAAQGPRRLRCRNPCSRSAT